ncbi:MAG: aldose 1-epimerase family protein [Planctomycetota bacterium]|nr:aldose 1-epimerase family protein [Planctomycetota bacterium]
MTKQTATNKSWKLVDCRNGIASDQLSIDQTQSGVPGIAFEYRRLRGGLSDGVDILEVTNGDLRCTLLPTRGMGIWKSWLGDFELGWKSPVRGPVHPQFVPWNEPSGLGWLDGFDELLVRCGLSSNGGPVFDDLGRLVWPLHGRIANLPAHKLDVTVDRERGEIMVRGVVDECRFHFAKLRLTSTWITRVGEPGYRVIDEVTNLSDSPGEMQLLYHCNVGEPLLHPGSQVSLPYRTMAPQNGTAVEGLNRWNQYGPQTACKAEQCYYFEPLAAEDGQTVVLLHDANKQRGVSLSFPIEQLPYFILWKNETSSADGYVTGLEPAINFPNPRTVEKRHGRVRTIGPHETLRFELQIQMLTEPAAIAATQSKIDAIQSQQQPTVHQQPRPEWSP